MIVCSFCNDNIDSDSYFCDQCGKEILRCKICGNSGTEKFCDVDGGELIGLKMLADSAQFNEAQPIDDFSQNQSFNGDRHPSANLQKPQEALRTPTDSIKESETLALINENIGLAIDIKHGDIIGRTQGPHSGVLNKLSYLSGRHASFNYDPLVGWQITDLNSTNKTKLSIRNNNWTVVPACQPDVPYNLTGQKYVLLADIEFQIRLSNDLSASINLTARI